jgi:hypothetical protein
MRYFLSAMLTAAVCATGCSPSGATANARSAAGQSCAADSDCEAGLVCGFWWGTSSPSDSPTCTMRCSKTADCQAGAVCATPPGVNASYCVPSCSASIPVNEGVCIDGVPTACSAVPAGSYCSECRFLEPCSKSERCDEASDRCVALVDVGGPCSANGDCLSNNCGTLPGTSGSQCFVNPGSACTAQNCGSCDTAPGGAGCAQSCTKDTDCAVLDYAGSCHPMSPGQGNAPRYFPCIGTPADGYFCRPPCDGLSACPPGLSCAPYTPGQCSDYLINNACQ